MVMSVLTVYEEFRSKDVEVRTYIRTWDITTISLLSHVKKIPETVDKALLIIDPMMRAGGCSSAPQWR
jgi:uracil phosphoribosyltransferase